MQGNMFMYIVSFQVGICIHIQFFVNSVAPQIPTDSAIPNISCAVSIL